MYFCVHAVLQNTFAAYWDGIQVKLGVGLVVWLGLRGKGMVNSVIIDI